MSCVAPHVFDVSMMSESKQVQVYGETLGVLRAAVQTSFDIPAFEQTITYSIAGDDVVLKGDDSVPLQEKGLFDVKHLFLARQVDHRFKTEKETAFLDALAACRFRDAKEILESSGVTIDPNCVRKGGMEVNKPVSESPCGYRHPALIVAMMSGLEHAVDHFLSFKPEKVEAWMSREEEVYEIVKLLIEKQADVNATGDEDQDCESAGVVTVHGKTSLCAAVQRGSPALVRLLLDAKADPDHTMRYDQSAWGPDRNNPLGPGVLKPESWLQAICNGSVGSRSSEDPRLKHSDEILALLHGKKV